LPPRREGRGARRPFRDFRLTRERVVVVVLALTVVAQASLILWARAWERTGLSPAEGNASIGVQDRRLPVPSAQGRAELRIQSEPPGATVTVDGTRRGATPLALDDVGPGEHEVVVEGRRTTLRQPVRVTAGETASLLVLLAPPARPRAPATAAGGEGRLSVRSPLELRIFEHDRLVGTSAMGSVPLARGSHRLVLRNEEVGFEETRTVTLAPARTTTLDVEIPSRPVAINATPWAEVLVDGSRVGETPIGALLLPLGSHTVVLRHPQLGEKSIRLVVKTGEPTRASVDMRR
jgi:archaellum component FlaF (FlaF/FlaG flagellin family)